MCHTEGTPLAGSLVSSLFGLRVPTPPENLSVTLLSLAYPAQGLSPLLLPTAPQPAREPSPFYQDHFESSAVASVRLQPIQSPCVILSVD